MEKLRALIREEIMREYLSRDMVSLRDYFSMGKEERIASLPYSYSYFLRDWIEEDGVELEMPRNILVGVDGEEFGDEMESWEAVEWLERNDKPKFMEFGRYLFRKVENYELPIADSEYPAWSFFGSDPEIVKNQWLIHFTNDAESIAREGFKYGVDEMEKLGLTTSLGEFDKRYGGYNFAYLLKDFVRYAKGMHGYKYGDEAVLFRASGIRVLHHGDQEPQVIFYGKTAKSIIPIVNDGERRWALVSGRTGRTLYGNEMLEKVVGWLVRNWEQYRSVLA